MEHLSLSNTIEALRRQLNLNANPMNMPDFNFSDSDLCCDFGSDPEPRFLDEYTEEDFHKILRENGFIDELKNLGYTQYILRMECKDKFVHRLSLLDRSLMTSVDQPITEKNFLMDMFMRKKELVTYQLKAYQDLKYRANRLPNTEAEELDLLPDVPEKRKFKPDYLKDDRDKKKTTKLRNLSDFSKIENNLADNLTEANKLPENTNSASSTTENNDTSSQVSSSKTTSNAKNQTNSQIGYNFSINLGRTFSLNRKPNPSSTHGSTVDVDVIEVSSSSSYSEEEEEERQKVIKESSNEEILENNDADDEDTKSNTTSSSIHVEIHTESDNNTHPPEDHYKKNIINDKVNDKKLPLDPKTIPENKNKDGLKGSSKEKDKNKHSSIDFSAFINNLTTGYKRNSQPPMTASSVINSIFSFLNNSIKEEKPIAPVIQTPASPPIVESSQESSSETNDDTDEPSSRPQNLHTIENPQKEGEETETRKINEYPDHSAKSNMDPSDPDKEKKSNMNQQELNGSSGSTNETPVGASVSKDETKSSSERPNSSHDLSLIPPSSEEVRKKKLTPLLVSKKGAMLLIKFLERNINVVPEMKITEIEWVCMQNPHGTFTTKRPQCPGQRFPGLKMGRKISNLMISLAKLKGRDGLCDTPEHFHNAAIYSQKGYMFINPAFHGYFVSLLFDLNKDMREHGLAAVSWAFKLGHVINRRTKKPEFWHPEEQIYPTSDRLNKYFISDQYLALVEHYRKVHLGRVYIDWNEAKECLAYSIKVEEIQRYVFSDNESSDDDEEEKEKQNNKEIQKNESKESISKEPINEANK